MSRRSIWLLACLIHLALSGGILVASLTIVPLEFSGILPIILGSWFLWLSMILQFPGVLLWSFLVKSDVPFLGYGGFLLNSALWGFVALRLVDRHRDRQRKTHPGSMSI